MSTLSRPKRATRQSSGGPASKRTRLNPPTVTRRLPLVKEVKQQVDVPWDNINVDTGATGTLIRVANIVAGDGPDDRDGRVIKILRHHVRLQWYKQNNVPQTMMRVILFRWGTGVAAPTTGSILNTTGVNALTANYNVEFKGIYKILHDKVYTINDFQENYNTTTGAAFTPAYHFMEGLIDFQVSDPHQRTFYIDAATGSGSSSTWLMVTAYNSSAYINESSIATEFVDV